MTIEFKKVETPQKGVVIGNWHLAFCTVATLSAVGHKMVLANSESGTQIWDKFPKCPVQEPDLEETLQKSRNEARLNFVNKLSEVNQPPDFAWVAIDTPVDESDLPDPAPVEKAIREAAKTFPALKCIFVSSQIPLGFLSPLETECKVSIVYVPENLRLGKGLETFYKADRTALGANNPKALFYAKNIMASFSTEFLESNLPTAEMIKHANNIFLATSISFANELASIGESLGVDPIKVGQALRKDKRIGPAAYLIPGLGFAGGTLPRDLRVIQSLGRTHKKQTPLTDAVLNVNENVLAVLGEKVVGFLNQHPELPRSVLILGYTYKSDTNTLRRSPSIDLAKILKKKGLPVLGFDPAMADEDLTPLKGLIENISALETLSQIPGVCILMTGRPSFENISWPTLSKLSKSPATLVLDTQNFFKNPKPLLENNFSYQALWSQIQNPG